MNSNSFKLNHLPKSTKDLSKEQLIEILKKKKECNDLALKIVEASCEENVNPDWLLQNLLNINQTHYEDIVTERSIIMSCGYPLCNDKLSDIPKQKYRISLATKNVYDITERKMFCSGNCFKASNFLKSQLLTSPLWFRDSETIPTFELMPLDLKKIEKTEIESNPEYMSLQETIVKDIHCDTIINKSATNTTTKSVQEDPEDLHNDITENAILEDPVRKIERAVEEWFGISTYLYLLGEEKLKTELRDKEDIFKAAVKSQSNQSLNSKRYDDLSKLITILKLDEEEEQQFDLKPLPDYSMLRAETKNLNIKVKAFYTGQLEVKPSEINRTSGTEDRNISEDIPLIDNQSQTALRRRVLLDQLNNVIPDVCGTLEFEGLIDLSDIRALTSTFSLSAHNVTFKPRERFLLAAVIIKLFSIKLEALAAMLRREETNKRLTLLLMSYNLNSDFLDNFSDWLIDTERLTRNFQ